MTTQQTEINNRELSVQETTKRPFIEPEISSPVDILETTAFFQVTTGGTDAGSDLTP